MPEIDNPPSRTEVSSPIGQACGWKHTDLSKYFYRTAHTSHRLTNSNLFDCWAGFVPANVGLAVSETKLSMDP